MKTFLRNLLVAEDGATMVEYALMVALIGAAAVATVTTLGTTITSTFSNINSKISGSSSS